MRYRLQRHDGTDCSATMVPITVLRMVPIQRYRHFNNIISSFSDIAYKICTNILLIVKKRSNIILFFKQRKKTS